MRKSHLMPLMALAVVGFAQDVMKMPLTDKSLSGTPLESVGSIALTESIVNNKAHDSKSYELNVRNLSPRPVLAFVSWLTITYPSGAGEQEIVEKDTFFGRKGIESTDGFMDFSSHGPQGELVSDLKGPLRSPHCEVQTMYVQFADGTTFGDEKYGGELLARRQQIWNILAQLNYVFRNSGEEEFVKELQKPVEPPAVDGFLNMFRSAQKEDGTQAAVDMIVRELNRAEEKSAAMNHPQVKELSVDR